MLRYACYCTRNASQYRCVTCARGSKSSLSRHRSRALRKPTSCALQTAQYHRWPQDAKSCAGLCTPLAGSPNGLVARCRSQRRLQAFRRSTPHYPARYSLLLLCCQLPSLLSWAQVQPQPKASHRPASYRIFDMVDFAHSAVLPAQPPLGISTERSASVSSTEEVPVGDLDLDDKLQKEADSEASSLYDKSIAGPLAPANDQPYTAGSAILHFLHIRRRPKNYELDAVRLTSLGVRTSCATLTIFHPGRNGESVFDGPLGAAYIPSEKYENKHAFDPAFRWTKREEAAVRRKIDFKIFLWCLVMFLALDIDRGESESGCDHCSARTHFLAPRKYGQRNRECARVSQAASTITHAPSHDRRTTSFTI